MEIYTKCSKVEVFIPRNTSDPCLPSTLLMMSEKIALIAQSWNLDFKKRLKMEIKCVAIRN